MDNNTKLKVLREAVSNYPALSTGSRDNLKSMIFELEGMGATAATPEPKLDPRLGKKEADKFIKKAPYAPKQKR